MEITFVKTHLSYEPGSTHDIPDALANYLVRVNVAETSTEKVEKVTVPEKVSDTPPGKVEIPIKKEKSNKSPSKEKVEK